eukprot:404353_1
MSISATTESLLSNEKNNKITCGRIICKIVAVAFIGLACLVIIGAVAWLYISHNLQGLEKLPTTLIKPKIPTSLFTHHSRNLLLLQNAANLDELSEMNYDNLVDHNFKNEITQEELNALESIFLYFDTNPVDNKWNKREFQNFIRDVVQPSVHFDKMDFNGNGVLSFAEITIFLQEFHRMKHLYKSPKTLDIINEIFNYEYDVLKEIYNIPDQIYFEYLTHLWLYELAPNKNTISKQTYINKIISEEWDYNNLNDDRLITLDEFQSQFFNSIYYSSFSTSRSFKLESRPIWYTIERKLSQIDGSTVNDFQQITMSIHSFDNLIIERSYAIRFDYNRPTESVYYVLPWERTPDDKNSRRLGVIYTNIYGDDESSCESNCEEYQGHCEGRGCVQDFDQWVCYCRDSSCIGNSGTVLIKRGNSDDNDDIMRLQLKDTNVGDYVFDGDEYTKIIFIERGTTPIPMITLHVQSSLITLTSDHLLYDVNNILVRSDMLRIGDILLNNMTIVDIEYNVFQVSATPLTISGKIFVNGIVTSCYTDNQQYAERMHNLLAPLRFISMYISERLVDKWYGFIHSDLILIKTDYILSSYCAVGIALKVSIETFLDVILTFVFTVI